MLVRELIDRLEQSGLLDHEIIEALRQQLEESGARVTPEAVVKLLVDNGHLTRFQATKLISDLRVDDPAAAVDPQDAADLDLTLADDGAQGAPAGADTNQAAIIIDDDDDEIAEAVAVDEGDDEIAEAVPVDETVAEAIPVEAEPVEAEAIAAESSSPKSMADLAPHPVVPTGNKSGKGGKKNKNVWDSIWIYGVGGLIVFLIAAGVVLYAILSRESADDFIAKANEAYEGANYPAAREVYTKFLDAYPGDKNVSMARTRVGIASIVIAKDSVGDPNVGLEKAIEVLPKIENESAFDGDRDDVSGILLDIGSALAERADEQELTGDKEVTLSQLDAWFELLDNPMYITSQARKSFGPRIKTIEETRARVVRDIARDRDLQAALKDMTAALKEKQTKQAFDVRSELVRKYPRLTEHAELNALVLEASQIQQDLVTPAEDLPRVSREAIDTEQFESLLLANRIGENTIPQLAGRVIYLRARGAVLAVAADTGAVLWRRFVGYRNDNPPVPLGELPEDGVLLSDGRRGELQRIANNEIAWRSQIGEAFSLPVVDGSTIFVTTESGRVVALDAVSGSARWVRQLPQSIPVGVGKRPAGRVMYVPGDHSNLYALSGSNGECVQSFYLGHELGTIKVPPVELLGHVFVFENRRSDYSMVRILAVDENTGAVRTAQRDIRLAGNVVTPPIVQGRRMIVLTDLGQIVVLDVEPTAENEKVTIAAEQVPTYEEPTKTEIAVGRSEVFVTGTQLARYELQINTGKVILDWSLHDADTFIAQPVLIEDVLIHARQMRGSQGVRITAARPSDGQLLWQNDVGVPVSMMVPNAETSSIYAVTSQAALYQVRSSDMQGDSTLQPVENAGRSGVAQRFQQPLDAGDGRFVMLNQESAEQLALLDPSRSREKLRVVTLSVPVGAKAEAGSLMMAGGLLLPLDNGRVTLLDIETGMTLGSAFQPPTRPGQKVRWTTPVASPADPEQLLICDDSPTLFRLRVGEQIRELSSTKLSQQMLGPAAAAGSNWLAAAGGAAGDLLITYSTTTLEETGRQMMGSRIAFGPVAMGDFVVLQTADGKLHRVGADAQIQWSIEIPSGQPAAPPIIKDGTMYVTGADGWVLAVNPETGEINGQIEIGQPLAGNPLIAGSQMLVPGAEGIIFVAERP